MSLPTAYQAHAAFDAGGLAGLLPKRRGPKQGHKLTPEILAHIEQRRRERPDWRTSDMQTDLQQRFGLTVHRRSLERVLRGKKNCRARDGSVASARCRRLRAAAQRGVADRPRAGFGHLTVYGLAAWLTALWSTPSLQQRPSEPAGAANRKSLPAAFASIILRLTQESVHA